LAADFQGQGDTRLTLMPSVIPNSNYAIMVSNCNCLKHICVFLYCNHQVHRDILITLYIYIYIYMIASHSILLRMRMLRTKVAEEIKTHFMFNNVIYQTNWENMVQPERPNMTTQYGTWCFACQITKARIHIHTQNI
jgi:hypothetical protein